METLTQALLRDAVVGSDSRRRDALRRLFDLHKDRVFTIALHFLDNDRAAAEDVTQEVFVRLAARLGQFRGDADFGTWLHRLVVNVCLDEQRRRRRFAPLVAEIVDDRSADSLDGFAARHDVRAALAGLSPKLRLCVLLKFFDDLSYDEMARALNCSPGTVASRLHRALKILAARLDPEK